MKALLWKDYRVNRVVLIVALVVLLAPLPAMSVICEIERLRTGRATDWYEVVIAASSVALGFSIVTVTLLGANAFAGERSDRSAEFMTYLPPTRPLKLASKAMFALSSGVMVAAVILLMAFVLAPLVGERSIQSDALRRDMMSSLFPAAVACFGCSWCASSVLSSPTYAAGVGFVVPWLILFSLSAIEYGIEVAGFRFLHWWITSTTVAGGLAFVVGCLCYVRRIEP